jgi:hypothetical protein
LEQIVAGQEVRQLLCLQLACVVLQLQRKRTHKQQQQQQQQEEEDNPAMQLLEALGLSAELNWSQFYKFPDGSSDLASLSFAIREQVLSAGGRELDAVAAAEEAEANGGHPGSKHLTWEHQQRIVPSHVAKPLLLTLLQLCAELAPQLYFMHGCIDTMLSLLMVCTLTDLRFVSEPAAAAAAAAGVGEPLTEYAVVAAYTEAAGALVQRLLHVLGPAVLKAVRKGDLGMPVSGQQAAAEGDIVMGCYGKVVLQVLMEGESMTASSIAALSLLTLDSCWTVNPF